MTDKQKLQPLTPLERLFNHIRFVKMFDYQTPLVLDDTIQQIYKLTDPEVQAQFAVTYSIISEKVYDHYMIDISYGRSEQIHHTKLVGTIEPIASGTQFSGTVGFTNNAVFELLFWFGLAIACAITYNIFGGIVFIPFGVATIAQMMNIGYLFNERNLLLRRLQDVIQPDDEKPKPKRSESAQTIDEPDYIFLDDDDETAYHARQ